MGQQQEIKSLTSILSKINGSYQRWTADTNLNYYLLQTLYALYVDNNITQKQISDGYKMPKQTVNNTIRFLKEHKYINLITQNNDKREKRIELTESGTEYMRTTLAPILDLDMRIQKRMGKERYQQLIQCLQCYADALQYEITRKDIK